MKAVSAALAILGAAALAGCASAHAAAHHAGDAASSAPATSAPPAQPPAANPSGTASGSCSYTLANDPSGTDYLTGEVDVNNTGNVGIQIRVKIEWPQEGFPPITRTKTREVPYGNHDYPVRFHVSAGSIDSGSNVIDNLQSWETGHNDPANDCTYHETIVNYFGTPH